MVSVRVALWLSLLVLPAGGCLVSTARTAPQPLDVSITTHLGDAQTFREGDPLAFFISLSSDAHVLMLYEDASGAVTQLVPNPRLPDARVTAGDFISMPPPQADFTLRVSAPYGAETVWLIATDRPLPVLADRSGVDGGIARLRGDATSIRRSLQQHASRNRIRYGEASVSITTRPQ